MEKTLRNIIEGVSNNYGKKFFDTITLKLHESIGSDFTFIAKIDRKTHTSHTISLVADGKLIDNISYSLTGTPCADLVGEKICLYPEKIIDLFPKDQLLVDMGIEGYVGTPLKDSKNQVIGITVALYKQKIKDINFANTIFQIFSGRIAAEIERTEYEDYLEIEVEKRTEHLENAINNLKKTQKVLIQQEKLASLGSVVAGIAHEINTPLGIAKTGHSLHQDLLQRLKSEFSKKTLTASYMITYIERAEEVMNNTDINLERAIDLIQNFKYAAVDRLDDSQHEHNLYELVSRLTISMAAEFMRSKVTCLLKIDKKITINTYGNDLTQIFSNLIMNALIHAFEEINNRTIEISAIGIGDSIEINVTDNGVGVDDSIKSVVFDPFITTKRHEGSPGLGMNIVHNQIVGHLKGSIELISPLAGGTQWKIVLPKVLPNNLSNIA